MDSITEAVKRFFLAVEYGGFNNFNLILMLIFPSLSVGVMVTGLLTGQPRDHGSILREGKRFLPSSKRPARLWVLPSSYSMTSSGPCPGLKHPERDVDHDLHLVEALCR